ncbi:hypothetical protein LTR08_005292 [Meristemomyces frigidus]|nr:hypothetical protein LTR08_005292 [Meristemomyces frigidus]
MHYTRSLQAYSTELVYEVEKGNATALLAASGLLAKLSFINTPLMSAEAAGGDPIPAWIRSMQGVKTIMQTPKLRQELESSMLLPIVRHYKGTAVDDDEFGDSQVSDGVIVALKEYCAADFNYYVLNPYASVLARLERMMLIEPTHEKIDRYLAFIATLEPSFIELLRQMETRALLILAYWCASLSLIQQWWTGPSARAECRRICAFLAPNPDPAVQGLLKFPAATCGFEAESTRQLPTPPSDG